MFISLDIEQYERNLSKVTEIGVSMYYPLKTESTDSLNTATGYLFPDIRAAHFIIKENHKFRNGKFVEDNRFRFAYGKSAYFSQNECIALLGEIFGKNDEAQKINESQPSIVLLVIMSKATFRIWKSLASNSLKIRGYGYPQYLETHTTKRPGKARELVKDFRDPIPVPS